MALVTGPKGKHPLRMVTWILATPSPATQGLRFLFFPALTGALTPLSLCAANSVGEFISASQGQGRITVPSLQTLAHTCRAYLTPGAPQLPGQGERGCRISGCLTQTLPWECQLQDQVTEVDGGGREGFRHNPPPWLRQFARCLRTSVPNCRFSQNPLESSERPGSAGGAQITNTESGTQCTRVPLSES